LFVDGAIIENLGTWVASRRTLPLTMTRRCSGSTTITGVNLDFDQLLILQRYITLDCEYNIAFVRTFIPTEVYNAYLSSEVQWLSVAHIIIGY
jgi:hypothetical protein